MEEGLHSAYSVYVLTGFFRRDHCEVGKVSGRLQSAKNNLAKLYFCSNLDDLT